MTSSNLKNLLSNYGSKVWGLISVFIFVPIYLSILGIENYAVIGFYTLILGIISFADSGMSSSITKEFALVNDASYKYSLLRRIENLYILVCVLLMILIVSFSNYIAAHWLTSDKIPVTTLAYYIKLIGIGVSIQLLSSLYFGALFGLNKQIQANSIQVIWNLFKAGIVVVVLIYFKATLEVYFIWQILCNIIYVLFLRYNIIVNLKSIESVLEDNLSGIPLHILKYIGGMTMIALISSINSQADKIITSSFFSLRIFGYYNMASILSQIPVILATPLVAFVFPLFSKFSTEIDQDKLIICFKKITFLLNIIIIPTALALFFYTLEILMLWAGKSIDTTILPELILVIKLLSIGSLFLGLQFPLFYMLLSKGKTNYTVYQGIFQICLGLPLLYICAKYFTLSTIGIPWIFINLGSLIYLTIIVFKKYIVINYRVFFLEMILCPFIISLIPFLLLYIIYMKFNMFFYIFCIVSGIISLYLNLLYFNYKNKLKLFSISSLYDFPN